jgi:hypothetical protein
MARSKVDAKSNKWFPDLSGRVDPVTHEAIRYLFQAVYSLRDGSGFGPDAKKVLTSIVQPLTINQILDKAQVALSGGGTHPIDITGSPGVSGQPQPSAVPVVTALPPIGDPLTYIGSRVIFGGVEYNYRPGPDGNPIWVISVNIGAMLDGGPLATFRTSFPAANYPPGTGLRITEGVIYIVASILGVNHWIYQSGYMADVIANIPTATLVADDNGFTFSATDYVQQYQWDGAGLQFHFQTNSGSAYVRFFGAVAPTYGLWGLADGTVYATSQDDGTVMNMTSPSSGAGFYWRR